MGVPLLYCLVGSDTKHLYYADVVELVDTPDLGSGAARCGGSSPLVRTIYYLISIINDQEIVCARGEIGIHV